VAERPGLVSWAAFTAQTALPTAWPEVVPADIALLQYTGGTTGMPKGAILTHANLCASVSMYEAWFNVQEGRPEEIKVVCVLPLFHIYALTTVLLRWVRGGGTVFLHARFDPHAVLRDIEEKRATHFPGVPTMWIALAALPDIGARDFSSLVYAGSGGAPLPVEVADRFERLTGRRLTGGWGMTETSPAGTNRLTGGPLKPGTIGLPLPGVEMDVCSLDDPARVLGPNETGELRIRGPNVTSGYWRRPEETAAAFVGDWFLTGDIGYVDEDGFFFIVDRKKDMIISGGFNVYPQMIEQAIYEHAAVEEVLVVGVPGPVSRRGREGFRQASARRGGVLSRRAQWLPGRSSRPPRDADRARDPPRAPPHCRRKVVQAGIARRGTPQGRAGAAGVVNTDHLILRCRRGRPRRRLQGALRVLRGPALPGTSA
jgi:long-chain acyl-CoA synthetase